MGSFPNGLIRFQTWHGNFHFSSAGVQIRKLRAKMLSSKIGLWEFIMRFPPSPWSLAHYCKCSESHDCSYHTLVADATVVSHASGHVNRFSKDSPYVSESTVESSQQFSSNANIRSAYLGNTREILNFQSRFDTSWRSPGLQVPGPVTDQPGKFGFLGALNKTWIPFKLLWPRFWISFHSPLIQVRLIALLMSTDLLFQLIIDLLILFRWVSILLFVNFYVEINSNILLYLDILTLGMFKRFFPYFFLGKTMISCLYVYFPSNFLCSSVWFPLRGSRMLRR